MTAVPNGMAARDHGPETSIPEHGLGPAGSRSRDLDPEISIPRSRSRDLGIEISVRKSRSRDLDPRARAGRSQGTSLGREADYLCERPSSRRTRRETRKESTRRETRKEARALLCESPSLPRAPLPPLPLRSLSPSPPRWTWLRLGRPVAPGQRWPGGREERGQPRRSLFT